MRPVHMIGLLLWRGGLLLIGAWILFTTARYALLFASLPTEIELGLGLVIAGSILVIVSLILERVVDTRAEGESLHD